MAVLSKHGHELARAEITKTHPEGRPYETKTARIILSYRSDGLIMRRVVSVANNGYKAPAVWRQYKKFKKGTDLTEAVAKHVAKLKAADWKVTNHA
jgi:hypothetical protein